MKWVVRSPKFGDMIRIKAGNIYHYGIYSSDEEVIQFGLAPIARVGVPDKDIEVCISDIGAFACDQTIEVGECENTVERIKRRSPELTVESAKAALGQKGYSIIHNNCEHFAYTCATGERFCSQTLGVRELFKNFPIVDVYVTTEKNQKTERELIEYAINRSFGKKPGDAGLEMIDGAWSSSICKIALARYDGLIAFCLSRADISLELSSPIDGDIAISDGEWKKNAQTDGIDHSITVKTATPQRVRLYNSLNI